MQSQEGGLSVNQPRCFFAHLGGCDGQLVRAHLLPRRLLKREVRYGIVRENGKWRPLGRYEDRYELPFIGLQELVDDPRSWVPMCGGATGISGHHGMVDHSRTLRIARCDLPAGLEEFAAEVGLTHWLTREYGPLASDERKAA